MLTTAAAAGSAQGRAPYTFKDHELLDLVWPKRPHAVHVATFLFFATWGEFSSGFIVASSCWEVANSGEKCEGVINIDRNLMAWVGSNQWKERAHGVSFSLVRWVGSYSPWKFRLHRWIKKCKPTVPKIGLNFHRLYLHNHQELEAPVKIWLVNAATFNAAEPVCVGLESLNYFYVDLLFVFVGKSTTTTLHSLRGLITYDRLTWVLT